MTDPLQIVANGLITVATPELFAFVEQYIQKEQVERIIIGKPTQPNGQPEREPGASGELLQSLAQGSS